MMGDTGPCGPCSEIFHNQNLDAKVFEGENEETADSCVEIWNLVFMQYNRGEDGALLPLPKPCVDTGMGLERISRIKQGEDSNYSVDLFRDLIGATAAAVNAAGGSAGDESASHRVIADHIRATAFLIADGVLPSNEGRGYVLRRIIRRALRHGHKLGVTEPFFHRLVGAVAEKMGGAHPVLAQRREQVAKVVLGEEESFARTLSHGMSILKKAVGDAKETIPGEVVFELYDTYGFPVDLTADVVREQGLTVDTEGFERCMAGQRSRSRASAKFKAVGETLQYDGAATRFVGRDTLDEEDAEIVAMFSDGNRAERAADGEDVIIVLDRTPFYAESGGQVGDTGKISGSGGYGQVFDTRKIRGDVQCHVAKVDGELGVGDKVRCTVDATRRGDIARNHSATHLMHAALREVLGEHVAQKGSLVDDKHLRFDFSHNKPMSPAELREVEAIVNDHVRRNHAVETEELPYDEAIARGATALFGEKYGDTVRMVSISPFSVELCGGTHASRSGDIGFFRFASETAVAAGVRRVEALTAATAVSHARATDEHIDALATQLKVPSGKIDSRIEVLLDELRAVRKENDALRGAKAREQAAELAAQATNKGDVHLLATEVAVGDGKLLREMAEGLVAELGRAAVLLAGKSGDKVALVAAVDKKLSSTINARDLVNVAAEKVGGRGGGKPEFAQAGGKDSTRISDAVAAARSWLDQVA